MFLLDSLLVGGLRFVFDKVAHAADAELNDPDRLREELLAAENQLELGEIDAEEYARLETAILERMREIRERQQGHASSAIGGGVQVQLAEDGDWHEQPPAAR